MSMLNVTSDHSSTLSPSMLVNNMDTMETIMETIMEIITANTMQNTMLVRPAAVSRSQSLVRPKDLPASMTLLELLKAEESVVSTRLRWLSRLSMTKLFSATTPTTRDVTQPT